MASSKLLAMCFALVAATLFVSAMGRGLEAELSVQAGGRTLQQITPKVAPKVVPKVYSVGGVTPKGGVPLRGWVYNFVWTPPSKPVLPLRKGDKLVFRWPSSQFHNVYRFNSLAAYNACDFRKGQAFMLPNSTRSVFTYTLPVAKTTYWFGCQVGMHCKAGGMKFSVKTA